MNFSILHFDTNHYAPLPMRLYWPHPVMVIEAAEVEWTANYFPTMLTPTAPRIMTQEDIERAEAFADLQAEAVFMQDALDRTPDFMLSDDLIQADMEFYEDQLDDIFLEETFARSAEDFDREEHRLAALDDMDVDFDRGHLYPAEEDPHDIFLENAEQTDKDARTEDGDYPDLTDAQWKAIEARSADYQDIGDAEIISGIPFEKLPFQRLDGQPLGELLDTIDEKGVSMREKFSLNAAINARFGAATCMKCNHAVHNCECKGGSITGMDTGKEQAFGLGLKFEDVKKNMVVWSDSNGVIRYGKIDKLDDNLKLVHVVWEDNGKTSWTPPSFVQAAAGQNADYFEPEDEKARPRCMFCGDDQEDCLAAGGHDMNGDKVSR